MERISAETDNIVADLDLPMAWHRLIHRISRHQRLLDMGAPVVIMRDDLALVAKATVELVAWVNDNVQQPSQHHINDLENRRYRISLAQHLFKHHEALASAQWDDEQLHALHDQVCAPDKGFDCEAWTTDYTEALDG